MITVQVVNKDYKDVNLYVEATFEEFCRQVYKDGGLFTVLSDYTRVERKVYIPFHRIEGIKKNVSGEIIMGSPETFWTLLHDAAHWEFEIFLMALFDGLLGAVLWPLVRRHWKHHIARDRKEGL